MTDEMADKIINGAANVIRSGVWVIFAAVVVIVGVRLIIWMVIP